MEPAVVNRMMEEVGSNEEELEAIYRLTTLASEHERYVIPPSHREVAEEMLQDNLWEVKGSAGLGYVEKPQRGL